MAAFSLFISFYLDHIKKFEKHKNNMSVPTLHTYIKKIPMVKEKKKKIHIKTLTHI